MSAAEPVVRPWRWQPLRRTERQPVILHELRTDVGLGLMVGRNRLSGRPLRVDLAYAFNPPPGRPRWQVSAGVQFSFVE